ncbi:hypothetical protein CKO28_17560 [Rhodovibrio sodomensis]|uniref:DUF1844 domain-containing protein n=1 Tax=Rhodovibrio sodomensis TaxID=1088 RepID=A0ABS1DIM0_9PROT|nr:hypothetical protein [Rhodovibrio sodomensis]MBK1669846.1 hypothetical protein [Rhodovibrio sodomensis]
MTYSNEIAALSVKLDAITSGDRALGTDADIDLALLGQMQDALVAASKAALTARDGANLSATEQAAGRVMDALQDALGDLLGDAEEVQSETAADKAA